ncbi:hypothetical protein [Candidatus Lokiarchaeum ossiferum]|uniref:hypothetical protein n=1 Tax=Candidatus Lokiarchaeum ossiferum TaxID=2951803 RepID=UPI00352FB812
MNFPVKQEESMENVLKHIESCKVLGHFQQVAYSVHGIALTQICFDCEEVRTNLGL